MDPPSDGDLSTSNSKGNTPHESIKESGSDAYKQPSAAQSRQRSFNESTLPKLQDTTSQPLQQRQKSSNSATDSPLPNLYPFENKQDTDASKVSVKPNTSKNAEYTVEEVYSSEIMPIAASPASAESISSPKHDANPTLGTTVPTTTQESGRIDNILVVFTNEKNAYEQEFAQMEAEFHAIHAEADPNADIFFRFLSEYKKVFVALSHSKSHAYELGDQFIAVQRECLNNDQLQVDGVKTWRKLEGSNPKAFDMIQLLHTLQKKLITKTKEDKEKKEFIKIQEELYLHLKNMLMKQVGPEALEQIEELETQFKNKSRQLRHMDTELNMYQAQVREYKYTIGQLDASLAAHKKQFLSLYHKRVDAIRNGASVSIQAIPHSADKINLPMLPEKPQSASQQNLQFTADMQLQDSTLAPDEVHDMNSAQAITDSITEPQEQLVVASAAEIPNLGTITI
ncbi:hypothetical protein BATDEDRAFT_24602 [Batrachochytrium dendrobatidis JAM81]|uniref:Uncharacterized protein n=1 Tax=Batrachochytrium dendrobatidis (strain JAM81 / FGSC 10211) TaxID=684364 RepID=F4P1U3_BATDJ|nr:uncharacterized protein BATDEDRAFT_24602 [Batrachochytrium dendrobatidis JAM81]EGF81000.1 hypothetical protein BATDEDRAFT_24602 [Batrachochytrium dendrobatidis JAM81]|eukprot:XP_006678499.1 hypothetical protein BATDEDRAFT_24602 [Batrachochytrium dendrobatidis JAM81]